LRSSWLRDIHDAYSKRRPRRNRRIKQIVFGDTGRAVLKVTVGLREYRTEQNKALVSSRLDLFPVRHRAVPRQSPKADLGMNLECPLLAFRRDRIVNLLDFRDYAPRPDAQLRSRSLLV
jgi:hypothetical protein